MLPDFIVCGAQRSGTTSLYEYMAQHPGICMSEPKEVHFFCWEKRYRKGRKWYEKHFIHCEKNKQIGEATPYYMYPEKVPKRINEIIPDAKLIFTLRNPVDRAYSHYWHEVKNGWEYLSFSEAIKKEKNRIKKSPVHKNRFSYLDRGKYVIQLKRFLKYFPKEQILVLRLRELKSSRKKTLDKVFRFLEVDSNFLPEDLSKKNTGGEPRIKFLQQFAGRKNPFIKPYPTYWKNNGLKKKITKYIGYGIRILLNELNLKNGYREMDKDLREKLENYFKEYNEELEILLKKHDLTTP